MNYPYASDPFRSGLCLVTSYRAAFPEIAPECLLQEMLARGPRWFSDWWLNASPTTRHNWLRCANLIA